LNPRVTCTQFILKERRGLGVGVWEFDIQIEKRDEGKTGAGDAWIVDEKLASGGKGLVEKTTSLPGNK
jgi:hypothetical protein